MNEGKIQRLKEALNKKEFLVLMFIYPNVSPIFKRGYVLSVNQDSFEFDEIKDGKSIFSYEWLASIKQEARHD